MTPLLLLLALLLSPILPTGDEGARAYEARERRQQAFVAQYTADNAPPEFATHAELDAYVRSIQAAWSEEMRGADAHLGRLSPDIYRWIGTFVADRGALPDIGCHVFSTFTVPAFLDDFERFGDEFVPAHAHLVPAGAAAVLGERALRCDLAPEDWARLHAALDQLPDILDRYVGEGALAPADLESELLRAKAESLRLAPLFDVLDAVQRGRLDGAFAGFAAAVTAPARPSELLPVGERLWRAYAAAGEAQKAVAVLDLIARSTTEGHLPTETIRGWYAEVAPEEGPRRFDRFVRPTRLSVLEPGDARPVLAGRATDLRSGESFDIAALEGRDVLFAFWTTFSAESVRELAALAELQDRAGERLTVVAVCGDGRTAGRDPEGARVFVREHGVQFVVVYDDDELDLAGRFGVDEWPSRFLVDADGRLLTSPLDTRRTVTPAEVRAWLRNR